MNEKTPTPPIVETEKETADRNRSEYAALAQEVAKEMRERHESFAHFPGMDPEAYKKAKATDEEYPEYVKVPIDDLLSLLKLRGCKIVFGRDPSTVFIVPAASGDSYDEDYTLFPSQLMVVDDMDEGLKKLVLAHKARVALYGK